MRVRRCRNCYEAVRWGRWCVDCVRAGAKTLAMELFVAALVMALRALWSLR